MRGVLLALCLVAAARAVTAGPSPCPGDATITVYVENLSTEGAVDVVLDGNLAVDAVTCDGTGAISYEEKHFHCEGHGTVRCGELTNLQPGPWVHRLTASVPGADAQHQAQRTVAVASGHSHVSNTLLWTVYPRTFVVPGPAPGDLQSALDQATAYTLCNPGPALITFSPASFPGAGDPQRIALLSGPSCASAARNECGPLGSSDGCPYEPGTAVQPCSGDGCISAGLCVAGDRIVIDGLDHDGRVGGVVLSVGTCQIRTLRAYGSDDVFRGLVFEGSQKEDPDQSFDADTVAISGPRAVRNRLEQSLVLGPSAGDGVGVDDGAGQSGDGTGDNVIVDCEVRGAKDKGVKVDDGVAVVAHSCVHDNHNGGIQVTDDQDPLVLAGHATATENVVQHNVPGEAQNGLSVVGEHGRSTLATRGNIVRFSGARGLDVTDNATAIFQDDYVSDNQIRGSTVAAETRTAPPPSAVFRGVALVCNRRAGLTGRCTPPPGSAKGLPCTTDAECGALGPCTPQDAFRYGAVTFAADGLQPPIVDYGTRFDPGRNVFASNTHDSADANFRVEGIAATVPAAGNQWSHCVDDASCADVSPVGAPVEVEPVADPLATDEFVIMSVTPSRPHAGDIVRIYGRGFDAINGNPVGDNCTSVLASCTTDADCPTGPCVGGSCPCAIGAIAKDAVHDANMMKIANRLSLRAENETTRIPLPSPPYQPNQVFFFPDAVTPTMVAFRMPVDCFAPLTLELTKRDGSGTSNSRTFTLCDPPGCAGVSAGVPCDDGNTCTTDDHCDGAGQCVGGAPLVCGTCSTCDASAGCVTSPEGTACDDGNPCTDGDHCAGSSATCLAGAPHVCTGDCATGACDPAHGCVARPAGVVCRPAADVCDVAETCNGTSTVCPPDGFQPRSTVCRPAAGPCDSPEFCSGRGAKCGRDARRLPTFVCRPAAGPCDVAEQCDGVSNECPSDVFLPAATVCRSAAGPCDVAEACDGVSAACPADVFEPATTMCRPQTGICDVAETCSGTGPACPPDAVAPDTTVCRRATDPCDVDDTCDGASHACPATDLRKTGPDAVTCAFDRSLSTGSCAGQAMPPRVGRLFHRASRMVHHAFAVDGRRRCARLRTASKPLAMAITAVEQSVHRQKPAISLDCAAGIRSMLEDARSRVHVEAVSTCRGKS